MENESKSEPGTTFEETAAEIRDLFSGKGADIPEEEIVRRLKELENVYGVPRDEARRSVINYISKKYGVEKPIYYGRPDRQPTTIGAILAAGCENVPPDQNPEKTAEMRQWATVTVRIVRLWENNHERIAQAGLAGDETGTVKFVSWQNPGQPLLEEGGCYTLKNVAVSRWNGKTQIELNKATTVTDAERDVQANVENESELRRNELRKVSGMNKEGMWTDTKVRIRRLWEETHESIRQAGLAGDETGLIKFTVWKTANCPLMEEGKCYLIGNAVVKEMNGRFSIDLNKTSTVEEIDEDIQISFEKTIYVGCAVDVRAGSGLIRRCPECRKVISKGICPEHGKVTGENDLRIKAVVDNGNTAQEVIIGRELTEKILGMTLREASLLAAENLDPEVVCDRIRHLFIGRYWKIVGGKTDRYIIADDAEPAIPSGDREALREMIEKDQSARSREEQRPPVMPEAI